MAVSSGRASKGISSLRCCSEWGRGAHQVAFLAGALTGALLPGESLGPAPRAALVLVWPLRVLPELPTAPLVPSTGLAAGPGW